MTEAVLGGASSKAKRCLSMGHFRWRLWDLDTVPTPSRLLLTALTLTQGMRAFLASCPTRHRHPPTIASSLACLQRIARERLAYTLFPGLRSLSQTSRTEPGIVGSCLAHISGCGNPYTLDVALHSPKKRRSCSMLS